ncbi:MULTISPECIES: DNA-binding anti-repressor SinI [Peribacillus]|uniref:DNA-binding anti-repressor SinI n=1 Tax=Peribacillus frigoritolerans TaxID=450367 RepID=A0AAJ1QSR5_9BACI|nr:DNA-binding anti-repressor SinI [Peribacillus frigoritolerans]MCD1160539.1 anti-repressor SinI family protein [Peribacillus castrilensis]QYF83387.1 anti-repressor SinI family protein [Brevibacterium sp. PAMC21349]MCK2002114.1 anti-repressor SinI family protein [Peribacillus frigoritolerans]MCM3167357.1 anti-repressor SinI family protein [Peribacillus frigoritolerans]MDM5287032.1 DNA-binding anti-repressor SinI [Peribacillus frigoritolerans]
MANVEMDQEWVKLISEARSLGFKKEEIIAFFKRESLEATFEENDGK